MAGRKYCKNTVQGHQRGKKYPAEVRAAVLMAMVSSNSICKVARRYRVPESTIRSWMAQEAQKDDAWAQARRAAAREIAIRASLATRAQVELLQGRTEEAGRAAQICEKLQARADEDVRARSFAVGTLLKSDEEELADAAETALAVYGAPGSYDRELTDDERKELELALERYSGRRMSDRDAVAAANVLMTVAERAAAMVPESQSGEDAQTPLIYIGSAEAQQTDQVVLEDGGT